MMIAWILLLDCVLCLDWARSVIGGKSVGGEFNDHYIPALLKQTPPTSNGWSGVFAFGVERLNTYPSSAWGYVGATTGLGLLGFGFITGFGRGALIKRCSSKSILEAFADA